MTSIEKLLDFFILMEKKENRQISLQEVYNRIEEYYKKNNKKY